MLKKIKLRCLLMACAINIIMLSQAMSMNNVDSRLATRIWSQIGSHLEAKDLCMFSAVNRTTYDLFRQEQKVQDFLVLRYVKHVFEIFAQSLQRILDNGIAFNHRSSFSLSYADIVQRLEDGLNHELFHSAWVAKSSLPQEVRQELEEGLTIFGCIRQLLNKYQSCEKPEKCVRLSVNLFKELTPYLHEIHKWVLRCSCMNIPGIDKKTLVGPTVQYFLMAPSITDREFLRSIYITYLNGFDEKTQREQLRKNSQLFSC